MGSPAGCLWAGAGQRGAEGGICLPIARGRNSGFKSPERKGVKMKNPLKKGLSGEG